MGLLSSKDMVKFLRYSLKTVFRSDSYDVVVGLESRGFLFGMMIADLLNVPLVPIRKEGKLPGKVFTIEYKKEYGFDTFQIQSDSISPGMNILVVDDIIATGGSLIASHELLKNFFQSTIKFFVLGEIASLREICKDNMKELYKDVKIFF